MADPGAELVVLSGIQTRNACPNFLQPFQIFSAQIVVYFLTWNWGHKPRSSLKQIGVSKFDATLLLAGHGMSGEKANADVFAEDLLSPLQDFSLGTADIGEQSPRGQGWAQAV